MVEAAKSAAELRAEAEHLRRLARGVIDARVLAEIRKMIEELEARAAALDDGGDAEESGADPEATS